MVYRNYFPLAVLASLLITFFGCHSDKGNTASIPGLNSQDSAKHRFSVVINNIPFPVSILDTMHDQNTQFHNDLLNPVGNVNLYSESNAQATNLGLYGADLAYVVSFEQFQSVGIYMRATKLLADNVGIPLAFTAQVIDRCQKNQNNKDSLSAIIVESYNTIDQTLKHAERNTTETLVLMGGWIEGTYLASQSLVKMPQGADKRKTKNILLEQKIYGDKLLALLSQVDSACPYCQNLATHMQDLMKTYNSITSVASFTDDSTKELAEKVAYIRSLVIKGNS